MSQLLYNHVMSCKYPKLFTGSRILGGATRDSPLDIIIYADAPVDFQSYGVTEVCYLPKENFSVVKVTTTPVPVNLIILTNHKTYLAWEYATRQFLTLYGIVNSKPARLALFKQLVQDCENIAS